MSQTALEKMASELRHYLDTKLELHEPKGHGSTKTSGYTAAVIPEWQLRQWANIGSALTADDQRQIARFDFDREHLTDHLHQELGDSYDCTRVWAAWGVGTMDEDDFVPLSERVDEIADGILALSAAVSA